MLDETLKLRFSNALRGLKAQANAVTNALPNNANQSDLANAQSLIAQHQKECQIIYKLVMQRGVPVPVLEESVLFEWLEQSVREA